MAQELKSSRAQEWGRRAGLAALVLFSSSALQLSSAFAQDPAARRYENTAPRVAPSVTRDSVARLEYPQGVQERSVTTPLDDAEIVKAIEHRIRCTCGCNLDVFTCRTTDFTCATSPAMHRAVLAKLDSSMTAEQVVAAFEAQYGQMILMQPPKKGFNWTAYIMPFIGLGVGIGIVVALMKRWMASAKAGNGERGTGNGAAAETASDPELERLERELQNFEG